MTTNDHDDDDQEVTSPLIDESPYSFFSCFPFKKNQGQFEEEEENRGRWRKTEAEIKVKN
jgi:hypothetical protein